MKVLRLGISDDAHGDLPPESRSWHIAAQRLEEATGDPWKTVLRPGWPSSSLTRDVESWLEAEQPDLVLFCCAAFPVSYPSAPLRIHRSGLPGAQRLARAAFWAASKPALAHRALFHAGRRIVTASQTTEFFLAPETALARVEQAMRTVLRHEEIAVAARGPLPLTISAPAAIRTLCEQRRAAFDAGLRDLCQSLHVTYTGFGPEDGHPPGELAGDRIHVNAAGHARRAEHEFEVMLRAWLAHTQSRDHQHTPER